MIQAWLVSREEKHVDMKYWVCLHQEDALVIARDVTEYWKQYYEIDEDTDIDVDKNLYGILLFHFQAEDCFRVAVEPVVIREQGEILKTGFLE